MPPSRSYETSNLVFFTYKRRKVVFVRPATHEDALNLARKTFSALTDVPPEKIAIWARLANRREEWVTPEAWLTVTNGVKHFTVEVLEDKVKEEEIKVKIEKEEDDDVKMPFHMLPPSGSSARGTVWKPARKPVIYLYSPTAINAKVRLSLIPQWKFSAVYPQPTEGSFKEGKSAQMVEWDVVVNPSGTISTKGISTEVAYLFWEAETEPSDNLPDSPPASRSSSPLPINNTKAPYARASFIPGTTRCSPIDSVVLSAQEVPPYLEKTLLALGLHTEARTSFITYWLPSLLKHEHLALRFIPQADFEAAAPLDIDPKPDVVTRVFMIFEGIPADRLPDWEEACERSLADVGFWKGVVGVEDARQSDKSLFRVLEWGGMEV
ncbi:hypothetical protein M407DRAFT_18964 [Tulasnella calospora MUT 4182]|uniref:Uncharacterized protein n=1 Tax=Tulasnella calospora MUT 4182 TaxID=1051891 RepID=A0A0C3QIZ9_9AGAM|nr:hypothetical protein M407DRAFT_18964 [Tulasnella calospora MUT 4182]